MKPLLLAGALMMISGAAYAQTTPPDSQPPAETQAPPEAQPPTEAPPATEAPPPAPPEAAAPSGPPRISWQPQQPVVQNAPTPPSEYPVCSRKVKDSCRNPGSK